MALKDPVQTQPVDGNKRAYFASGCFWCVEAVYERIDGVETVEAGYSNGHTNKPTYKEVCSGSTGYVEAVRVTFDPQKVTFSEILDIFWKAHDPTTLNRQGADVGTQYRSGIYYSSQEQKTIAEKSLTNAQSAFDNNIVTEILPVQKYTVAEDYHQDYYNNNKNAPYCSFVITPKLKKKLGLFCNVETQHVFESPDVDTIYEIPLVLNKQNFDFLVIQALDIKSSITHKKLFSLQESITIYNNPKREVTVAMCGKYNGLQDAYKSILEAFIHAGIKNSAKVNIKWINTENIDSKNMEQKFKGVDGILIPGGFGSRGIEGKITSSRYARENNVPFLGICLGLQCAVIDFARNVSNLDGANSSEFKKRLKYPVIDIMPKQKKIKNKGATMRLGSYSCDLVKKTKVFKAYKKLTIHERHRHRYEVNNRYLKKLSNDGLIISGKNKRLNLVEIIELKDHLWFVGVQFHPELKSRIVNAHPLFQDFIGAAIKYNERK